LTRPVKKARDVRTKREATGKKKKMNIGVFLMAKLTGSKSVPVCSCLKISGERDGGELEGRPREHFSQVKDAGTNLGPRNTQPNQVILTPAPANGEGGSRESESRSEWEQKWGASSPIVKKYTSGRRPEGKTKRKMRLTDMPN